MKKPKKPKAKRPASGAKASPRGTAVSARGLGSAAEAFLGRQHATPAAALARPGQPDAGRAPAGRHALGGAARSFLERPLPVRAPATAPGSLADTLDQRVLVTLLLMPFFLLAFALAMSQTWRHGVRVAEPVAVPAALRAPARPVTVELAPPALRLPPTAPVIEVPEVQVAAPALRLPSSAPVIEAPVVELAAPALRLPATPPEIALPTVEMPVPAVALPAAPPAIDIPTVMLPAPMLALPAAPPEAPAPEIELAGAVRLPLAPPPIEPPEIRLAAPIPELPRTAPAISPPGSPAVCLAEPGFGVQAVVARPVGPGEDFGERLAAAAQGQIGDLVIYNDKYQRIAYPMGDVPAFFGVCTDVVIRAYRGLGIDLQELVAKARVGSGDTSIQHRRTETLRRLMASRGASLPVTQHAENYLPGDIVTYYRPQNRASRSHIAIVSDRIAPSGRPMIIHNRGWGPQLEDALFVDRITGHYRFRPTVAQPATAVAAVPATPVRPLLTQRKVPPPQSRPVQKAAYTPAP